MPLGMVCFQPVAGVFATGQFWSVHESKRDVGHQRNWKGWTGSEETMFVKICSCCFKEGGWEVPQIFGSSMFWLLRFFKQTHQRNST